jgi:bacteriocin-like protein
MIRNKEIAMSIEPRKDSDTKGSLIRELTEHELDHVSGGGSKPGGSTDPITMFGAAISTAAQ